jgi:ribosome biogenesis GTPase
MLDPLAPLGRAHPSDRSAARRGRTGSRARTVARDVPAVRAVPAVREALGEPTSAELRATVDGLDAAADVAELIERAIDPEAPGDLAAGGVPPELAAYGELGYPILPASTKDGRGMEELRERLKGRITVFAGPSGAGKSSLANTLMPGLDLRVGQVRERSGQGRHTTVGALLIPLPGDGYLADTPGIQHFEPGAVDPSDLQAAFPEFRPHLDS